MRVLITIFTSNLYAENGICQAQRDTWLKDILAVANLDYKFFMGRGDHLLAADEVRLDVEDSLYDSSSKSVEMRRWSLNAGYDYSFLCANDTYVRPERLLASGFEAHEYVGYPVSIMGAPAIICPWTLEDDKHNFQEHRKDFCSGGAGYWTSKTASWHIVNTAIGDPVEDRWIGNVMSSAGIPLFPDPRYNWCALPSPLRSNDMITCHLSVRTGEYDVQQMYQTHERWLKSLEEL